MPLRIAELTTHRPHRIVQGSGWFVPEGPYPVSETQTFAVRLADGRSVDLSEARAMRVKRGLMRRGTRD